MRERRQVSDLFAGGSLTATRAKRDSLVDADATSTVHVASINQLLIDVSLQGVIYFTA